MTRRLLRLLLVCGAILSTVLVASPAAACGLTLTCQGEATGGAIVLEFSGESAAELLADDSAAAADYAWRLRSPCLIYGEPGDNCSRLTAGSCAQEEERVIRFMSVQRRPVVRPDGTAVVTVPADARPGDPIGPWTPVSSGCFDVTEFAPAPSPDEVFHHFERLPLPQLTTRHQPPGPALVGLPVIFFTDTPTTVNFTINIRGFRVDVTATATRFSWRTGDGTVLTSTDPGAPYPAHTVTHGYRSGSYTATLTTTWSGTFRVNGGADTDIPGSTTTEGLPVTITVLEARAILTSPFN